MNTLKKFFIQDKKPLVYIKTILIFLILFTSFHAVVWNLYTKQLLKPPYPFYAGDLSRLSYQVSSLNLKKLEHNNLENKHISLNNWKEEVAEIVTIGDSFSNGGAFGLNPYYQDYISTLHNISTLNIQTYAKDPPFFNIILALLNNNTFKKMKTKIVIIESVERYTLKRLATNYDWNSTINTNYLFKKNLSSIDKVKENRDVSFINNGNYKFIWNTFLYAIYKKPYEVSNIYQATLNKNMFTVQDPSSLLFYYHDIKNIKYSTNENIIKMNKNLNHLAQILKEHDISLLFMPAVDKYNLYSSFIKNNNLPRSEFFKLLRPLEKNYYFVDTKEILLKYLPLEKDIFYADDTHWSYKASEHIVKSIPFNQLLSEIK